MDLLHLCSVHLPVIALDVKCGPEYGGAMESILQEIKLQCI